MTRLFDGPRERKPLDETAIRAERDEQWLAALVEEWLAALVEELRHDSRLRRKAAYAIAERMGLADQFAARLREKGK